MRCLAGTGTVGFFFRQQGHKVIANDIQYYSYVINKNLIENPVLKLDKLDYLNSLEPVEGFIYQNYCAGSGSGRMYFSDENGKRCDAIRQEIERLKTSSEISETNISPILPRSLRQSTKLQTQPQSTAHSLKSSKEAPAAAKTKTNPCKQ